MQALERYPELIGFGHSVIVPAAQLPAFAAQAVTDPAGPLAANGTFQVVPPGDRPYYCLAVAAVQRDAQQAVPAGADFCSPDSAGIASLADRDLRSQRGPAAPGREGHLLVHPDARLPGWGSAGNGAGAPPPFLGWVGMAVMPQVVLGRALQGHPNTAVTFRYQAGSSTVAFQSGRAPSHAQSTVINLHDGWTVTTFGVVAARGWRTRMRWRCYAADIVLSLLLGVLMLVLGTGTGPGARLIDEHTGELRHQAYTTT